MAKDELTKIEERSSVAQLRAELKTAEAEDELTAAKADGLDTTDPDKYRRLKLKVREARQASRTIREGGDPTPGAARPATVTTKARKA